MTPTGIPILDAIIFTVGNAVALNAIGIFAIIFKFLGIM